MLVTKYVVDKSNLTKEPQKVNVYLINGKHFFGVKSTKPLQYKEVEMVFDSLYDANDYRKILINKRIYQLMQELEILKSIE